MKTSELGIKLIKYYESLHDGDLKKIGLQPKMDCSGYWTIGYGHLLTDINGKYLSGIEGFRRLMEIYPDYETITVEEAEDLLKEDIAIRENNINALKLNLTQYQFDAVVSIVFNIGFGNFKTSTLLRRLKGEKGSISEAFKMFNKSNGKVWPGLVKRRNTEAVLFESGSLIF